MNTLAQHFAQHWKERHFPTQGTFLLALSGGIDSMVLAHLLLEIGIDFVAAHCNFSLRKEASEDASFVANWCQAHNITCHQISFDTKQQAAERKQSIQLAARELRYDWFESLQKKQRYSAILTAHQADDVAETMLINLCRGTGIRGLHGIPERNGSILRPLLFARRGEIESYAMEKHIAWREDASNAEDKYLRNAIRNRVLPMLEELTPGASDRIAQTAQRILGAELIFQQELLRRLARLQELRGQDIYIPIGLLRQEKALSTLAFELFHPYGFSAEQVPQILDLMDAASGRQIHSPTHRVIRHRAFLVLNSLQPAACDLIQVDELPARFETSVGIFLLEWTTAPTPIPDEPQVAFLNGDHLQLPLQIRPRREGDYFYPLGMGMKKKKIKRFLIDQKLGIHEKERIRIVESEGKILWLAGQRIDERFKFKAGCKRVLKISFQPMP
ncbi:MAG: tRNA lysidine(34) synthetase TilS [Bacteroidetes bacterium]|nr:tRNA lysidine(34) synthetase TilS [Bacteroidota bacterium]MBS1630258.1 tRNA lysidine(34) synthetase TilS [Bacteroidota bacterium]